MGEIEEISSLVSEVDGWLSDLEGAALYDLARHCTGRGVIVEIGSWKGKSTVWLAKGSLAGKRTSVFAVDPHVGLVQVDQPSAPGGTFDEFMRNVEGAGIGELVTPVVSTSADAARDFTLPVELIFIDGLHEYEYTKQDFELWFPKVIEGGMMAFHDTNGRSGSTIAVDELVYRSDRFREVHFVDSMTVARKVGRNTLFDRIRNRFVLFTKNVALPSFGLQGKWSFVPQPVRSAAKKCVKAIERKAFGSRSSW